MCCVFGGGCLVSGVLRSPPYLRMGAEELRASRGIRPGPLTARTVSRSVFTFSVISGDGQVVCIGNGNLKVCS